MQNIKFVIFIVASGFATPPQSGNSNYSSNNTVSLHRCKSVTDENHVQASTSLLTLVQSIDVQLAKLQHLNYSDCISYEFIIECIDIDNGKGQASDFQVNEAYKHACYRIMDHERAHSNARNSSARIDGFYLLCPFTFDNLNVTFPHANAITKHTLMKVYASANDNPQRSTYNWDESGTIPSNVNICHATADCSSGFVCTKEMINDINNKMKIDSYKHQPP